MSSPIPAVFQKKYLNLKKKNKIKKIKINFLIYKGWKELSLFFNAASQGHQANRHGGQTLNLLYTLGLEKRMK